MLMLNERESACHALDRRRGVWGEIKKLLGGNGSSAITRHIVGLLATSPDPVTILELSNLIYWRHTASISESHVIRQVLEQLKSYGIAEVTEDVAEMRALWKDRLTNSSIPEDRSLIRSGARLFATAIKDLNEKMAPVAWSAAPQFLATARMYGPLGLFLVHDKNFDTMLRTTSDTLAILAWCKGIAAFLDHRPSACQHWIELTNPILATVLTILEGELAPCGWLRPLLHDLVMAARDVEDEALFDSFRRLADINIKTGQPERMDLALIQLMAEAGDHDRAIRLARVADAKHWSFDTAHFLALALLEKGRTACDGATEYLRECIEIEETRSREVSAVQSMSYRLRRSVLARAHNALRRLVSPRGCAGEVEVHQREAIANIEARFAESQNLQVAGYRAEIHFNAGDFDVAWRTASDAAEHSIGSMEAGSVLLKLSSTDPLKPRFVPYCRQQAIAWMLAHAPYKSTDLGPCQETVLQWALRERIWPMALAENADCAELAMPGITSRCMEARRNPEHIRIGTYSGVLQFLADRWDFHHDDGSPFVVVSVPRFGVFARGRNFENAVDNLERALHLIEMESRRGHWRPLPIVARLVRWKSAHTAATSLVPSELGTASDQYQRGHFAAGMQHIRRSLPMRASYDRRRREEFDRILTWLTAEAGDPMAIDLAMTLFDAPNAISSHYTDLQKAGVAIGLIPHKIVKDAHERFEELQLGQCERGFAALERFYWGLYLLGQEENSAAEEALSQALSLEIGGHNEQRVLARMGDALAEALRRRGDIPRAIQILDENIAYREDVGISAAPSYVQRAKCQSNERAALSDLRTAQSILEQHHPKDLIRALLIEARITSDPARHEAIYGDVLRRSSTFPGVSADAKFCEIVERWENWCGILFSPELSYWGL